MKTHDDMFRRIQPESSSVLTSLTSLPFDQAMNFLQASSRGIRAVFEVFYAIWMFRRFGHQVFQVGPELQEMFAKTSISRVPVDLLSLPYQGFYVALPDCKWVIWGGSQSQWHQVSGVYVSESLGSLRFLLWGAANERSVDQADDATLWLNMDMEEAALQGNLEEVVDAILSRTDVIMSRPDGGDPVNNLLTEGMTPEDSKIMNETCRNVIRMVINMMLYVGTDSPNLTRSRPNLRRRQKLQKRIANMRPGRSARERLQAKVPPPTTITYVGPSIESEMADIRQQAGKGFREHWVRGHGRWVPCGPRDAPRYQFRYIKPYKRGDDSLGTVEGRTYRMRPPGDER